MEIFFDIVNFMISITVHLPLQGYVSVSSKPDYPPRATPGDSHILVAPGVGFSPLCLAQGSARAVLNQSKSSITLKKKRDFCFAS